MRAASVVCADSNKKSVVLVAFYPGSKLRNHRRLLCLRSAALMPPRRTSKGENPPSKTAKVASSASESTHDGGSPAATKVFEQWLMLSCMLQVGIAWTLDMIIKSEIHSRCIVVLIFLMGNYGQDRSPWCAPIDRPLLCTHFWTEGRDAQFGFSPHLRFVFWEEKLVEFLTWMESHFPADPAVYPRHVYQITCDESMIGICLL